MYVRLCAWKRDRESDTDTERERARERRGGVHPHSLYPYLTVNPPVSLLLLAHCVSRIPSLRALTHCTLLLFSRSALPDACTNKLFNEEIMVGDTCRTTRQSLARNAQQQLGVLLWSVHCVGLCWTSHPPSVLSRLDVFPAALCDCASRWYHNSHGFHAQRWCGL